MSSRAPLWTHGRGNPKLVPDTFEPWQHPATNTTLMERIQDAHHIFIPMSYFRSCARGWQDFRTNDRMATVYAMALQFVGESLRMSKSLGTNPGHRETFYYTPDGVLNGNRSTLPEDGWVTNYHKVICMMSVIVKDTQTNFSDNPSEVFDTDMTREEMLDTENILGILVSQLVIDPGLSLHALYLSLIHENIEKSPEYERLYVCQVIPQPHQRQDRDADEQQDDAHDQYETQYSQEEPDRRERGKKYVKSEDPEKLNSEACLFRRVKSRKDMLALLIDGVAGDGRPNALDNRIVSIDTEVDRIIGEDSDSPISYRSQGTLKKALERARELCPHGNSPQLDEHEWYSSNDTFFRSPVPALSWFMKPEQMSSQRMWGRLFPWSEPSLELLLCRVIGRILKIQPDTLRKDIHANIESQAQSRVADSLEAPLLAQMRNTGTNDIIITSKLREISRTVHMFRDYIMTTCFEAEKSDNRQLAGCLKPALSKLREIALREFTSTLEPSANIPEPIKALAHWQETSRDHTMCFNRPTWCRNLGAFGNMITGIMMDFSTSGISPNGFALLQMLIARDSVYIDMNRTEQLPMNTILASVPAGGKSKLMRMVAHVLSVPGTLSSPSGSSAMGLLAMYSEKVPGDQVLLLDEMPRMFTMASSHLSSVEQKVKAMLQAVLTSGVLEYVTTEKNANGQLVRRTRKTECNMVVIGGTNDQQIHDAMNTRFTRTQMIGTDKPGQGTLHRMFARNSLVDIMSSDSIATQHKKAHFLNAAAYKGMQTGWLPNPCNDLLQLYMTVTLEWMEREHSQLLSKVRKLEIASTMASVLTTWFARHIVFSSEISPLRRQDDPTKFRDFSYKDLMQMAPYLFVNEDIIFFVLSGIVHAAVDPFMYKLVKWIAEAKACYRFHLLWDECMSTVPTTNKRSKGSDDGKRPAKRRRLANGDYDGVAQNDYDVDDADEEQLEQRYEEIAREMFCEPQIIKLSFPKTGGPNRARALRRAGMQTTTGRGKGVQQIMYTGDNDFSDYIDYPLFSSDEMREWWIEDCQKSLRSRCDEHPFRYKREYVRIGNTEVMCWNFNYLRFDGSIADCANMFTVQNPSSKMSQADVVAMLMQLERRLMLMPYLPLVEAAKTTIRSIDVERFRNRLCKHGKCQRKRAPALIAGDAECFLLVGALRHSPDQITSDMLYNLCHEDTVERDVVLSIQNTEHPNLMKVYHAKPRPGRKLVCRNANYVSNVHRRAIGDVRLDEYRSEQFFITDKSTITRMLGQFFQLNGLDDHDKYTTNKVEEQLRRRRTEFSIPSGAHYPDDAKSADNSAETAFQKAVSTYMDVC